MTSPPQHLAGPRRSATTTGGRSSTSTRNAFGMTVPGRARASRPARPTSRAGTSARTTATRWSASRRRTPSTLTVPGGTVPAAGVSWVGVLPTHRRRGVLSALMDHQLTSRARAGREPMAVLWASEPQIYGRFGYGLASRHWSTTVPRERDRAARRTRPRTTGLRLRLVPADDWTLTAGGLRRGARPPARACSRATSAGGRGPCATCRVDAAGHARRCAASSPRTTTGSAATPATRPSSHFGADFGQGVVDVREVLAVDPAALATLYRYLFDLDLMGSTDAVERAGRRPAAALARRTRAGRSPSAATRSTSGSSTSPAALAARTYAADVDVVLDVDRPALPVERRPLAAHRRHRRGDLHAAPTTRPTWRSTSASSGRPTSAARRWSSWPAAGRVSGAGGGAARERPRRSRTRPAAWCPVVF